MTLITPERLRAFASHARADIIAAFASHQADIAAAGLTTPRRVAHFMAQVGHESGLFTDTTENLNYQAEKLHSQWPTHFQTIAIAKQFEHKPVEIANRAYGGRMGNTQIGDGWRYRGRGLIQTTGREGYREIGHENDPEVVEFGWPALDSALKFWTRHRLNQFADLDDVEGLRRVANGGKIGLEDVKKLLVVSKRIFANDASPGTNSGSPGSFSPSPGTLPPDIEPTPAVKAKKSPAVVAGAAVTAGATAVMAGTHWVPIVAGCVLVLVGTCIAVWWISKQRVGP